MNTTIKNFSKVLLVAITIFSMTIISSCSKDGDIGAAGKDGLNGAVGATGTTGSTGSAGPIGSANVIYSNWISADFVATGSAYYFTIPLPASVTYTDIFNRYHVSVYYDLGALHQLPMKDFNLNAEISYLVGSSGFRIQVARAGVATPDIIAPIIGTINYDRLRYVLIPGSIPAGRGISPPDYSKMTYHDVCRKFNIPE